MTIKKEARDWIKKTIPTRLNSHQQGLLELYHQHVLHTDEQATNGQGTDRGNYQDYRQRIIDGVEKLSLKEHLTLSHEALPSHKLTLPESRFSIKRISFSLRRDVTSYTSSDGSPGHFVKTEQDTRSPVSSLGWTDNDLFGRFNIPGDVKFTTQKDAVVFTAPDTGASLTYYQDGSFMFAASGNSPLSRRERLRAEQSGLPWWEKDREVIEREYIYETGRVIDDPVYGHSSEQGTPYKHFKLAVPVSETETREFDVYTYGQAIGLLDRRKIHKDDLVRLRVSVRFHEQRQSGSRSIFIPWLNLFDVQKLK